MSRQVLAGRPWTDLVLPLLCGIAFAAWYAVGSGSFSLRYLLAAVAVCVVATVAGHLLEATLRFGRPFDFPVRFVGGFFLVNTVLYVLTWALPFGIVADFWILAGVLAAATAAAFWRRFRIDSAPAPPSAAPVSRVPAVLCVVISLAAATLWSQDCLQPVIRDGGPTVILRPWGDFAYHTSVIATFAQSRGGETIHEPRMAGAPQPITYHFASYIFPAFLTAAGGAPALLAFGCFWVPVGIFLTGLAAYALVRWWWGAWPALAACAALLLTPDASGQWSGNAFLSYHWLAQAAAGTAYGIAIVALAWVVMFEACRSRRFSLVPLSFVTLGAGLVYKSHMVVPSALLLWVYPAVFMPRLPRARRTAWVVAALATFFAAVAISQRSSAVPLIRLDFSAAKDYLTRFTRMFEPADGWPKRLFTRFTPDTSLAHDLAWGAPMLFLCTFGVGGLLYPVLAAVGRRRIPRPFLLFPLAMIAVYLLMSLGLAYDTHGVGAREELLHRPFPWAYFVLYAWLGGAAYYLTWRDAPPARTPVRVALAVLLLSLVAVPAVGGRGIQVGPARTWGTPSTDRPFDAGLVDCATFVRNHDHARHGRRPVIQDSANDPLLVVGALSEAQPYAAAYNVAARATPGLPQRLDEVRQLPLLRDGRDVRAFAAGRGITWYLLHPDTKVAWPRRLLGHPAYESHGYRLYHFPPRP